MSRETWFAVYTIKQGHENSPQFTFSILPVRENSLVSLDQKRFIADKISGGCVLCGVIPEFFANDQKETKARESIKVF